MPASARTSYPAATRVVAKIGSATLMGPDGRIDEGFLGSVADQVAALRADGCDVVVVTSGAIAAALAPLGLGARPADVPTLQACAAVGQVRLADAYARVFAARGLSVGQVLLTRNDTGDRTAYLNARQTLARLLELGVVPVVNENDTVAVDEIRFGDNDSLAAIVGPLAGADLVVLMSDIDGLYTADPHLDPAAQLIEVVDGVDEGVMALAGDSASGVGTGGMRTKVRAGRAMQQAGIPLVVCLGRGERTLERAARGEAVGTRFVCDAAAPHEGARKLWIGYAGHDAGSVTVDDGARDALHARGGSLLPVGVVAVEGRFDRGDIVAVYDRQGTLVARGVAGYTSDEARLTMGMRLDMVARVVPALAGVPLVHRDELLVF
jgi:glutamate 5-kinase